MKTSKIAKTIVLYLAFLSMGFFQIILGATLPELAANTNASIDQISIVFSALFLGYMLGSFFNGRLFDHYNPTRLISFALMLGICALFFIPLIHQLWLLVIIAALMGFGSGTIDIGSNLTLVWVHDSNPGPFMNGLHGSFSVGAFITPLLIGKILSLTGSVQWAYWIPALLVIPVAVLMFFSTPPARPQFHEQNNQTRAHSPMVFVFFFAAILLCAAGSGNSFSNWILTYTQQSFPNADASTAYQMNSLFWIMIAAIRFISIPFISKIRSEAILIFDIGGFLLSSILVAVFSHSLGFLWFGTALAGIAVSTTFPSILVFCNRVCGMKGSSTRWLFLGASIGNISIPWIIGQVFESRGPVWTHIIHAIFLSAGLTLLLILIRLAASRKMNTAVTTQ